jgi:hypothetical protein
VTALVALALLQAARDVAASEGPIDLRVPVSTEGDHRATVVTFPEEALEALVAGWNEGDLSVERRRENLFLKLLRPAKGDVHVVGASGRLYRLAIRPAGAEYDGHVRIAAFRPSEQAAPEPIELVRAMRLGRRPVEGRVRRADGVLYESDEFSVRMAYVYDTDNFRGHVVRVENRSPAPLPLDPSRFVGRDLVLAGAREMLLPPGGSTLLYLVFGRKP